MFFEKNLSDIKHYAFDEFEEEKFVLYGKLKINTK